MFNVTEEIKERIENNNYFQTTDAIYTGRAAETLLTVINSGYDIIIPADNELFIDIDSPEAYEKHQKALLIFNRLVVKLELVMDKESKTPGHKHLVYRTDSMLTTEEVISYQALLGSDNVKEMLSLDRYYNNVPYPILFFEKREEAKKKINLNWEF